MQRKQKPGPDARAASRTSGPVEGAPGQKAPGPEPRGAEPFWRAKTLDEMTHAEWESLCDGCGRCCLLKLEDDDTGEIHLTRLSCRLLDNTTCRCRDYPDRHASVPDCVTIDPDLVRRLPWLPESCAYRRLAEGDDLAWWHPLVSGSPDTVHEAGISVRGWSRSEDSVKPSALHRHIIKGFGKAGSRKP